MNIDLHIERLVLHGIDLPPDQHPLLQASLTAELTRLLGDGGLARHMADGVSRTRLSAGGIPLTEQSPQQLGERIAQSIYGGLGHE
jgi:hypothetical protein